MGTPCSRSYNRVLEEIANGNCGIYGKFELALASRLPYTENIMVFRESRVVPSILFFVSFVFMITGLSVSAQPMPGSQESARPTIAVIPPWTARDDADGTALAERVADITQITFEVLDRYRVALRPTPRTAPRDVQTVASYANAENVDYVVFGEIRGEFGTDADVELSVYSQDIGAVILTRTATITTDADADTAAARLVAEVLQALTGDRIVYGRVELVNRASPPGEYLVYVDGNAVGRNAQILNAIPTGERLIEVVPLEGPHAREAIVSQRITVSDRVASRIAFTVGAPDAGDVVAVAPQQTVERDAVTEPERELEQPVEREERAAEEPPTQPETESRMRIGFRAGYSFAWLGGDGYRDAVGGDTLWSSPIGDLSFGALFEFSVAGRVPLEIGALSATRGGRAVTSDTDLGSITYTIETSVFSLTTLWKPRVSAGASGLYIVAGPRFTWVLSDLDVKMETDDLSTSFDAEVDNDFLIGAVVGTGVDVPLGRGSWFVDLMYGRALTSFYDDGDWFFNSVTVGAGYTYHL